MAEGVVEAAAAAGAMDAHRPTGGGKGSILSAGPAGSGTGAGAMPPPTGGAAAAAVKGGATTNGDAKEGSGSTASNGSSGGGGGGGGGTSSHRKSTGSRKVGVVVVAVVAAATATAVYALEVLLLGYPYVRMSYPNDARYVKSPCSSRSFVCSLLTAWFRSHRRLL